MNNRIKELRQELNYSQVRLSIELGVSQEAISSYEAGRHYPSAENLIKLSKLLNSSIDYILGLSDLRHPVKIAELSPNEHNLIYNYRKLDDKKIKLLLAYIDVLISEQ